MRFNRFTTWFLLGYLALLLNVGRFAHHAEFLGLHASSCCHAETYETFDTFDIFKLRGFDLFSQCDCAHHGQTVEIPFSLLLLEELPNVGDDTSCGDCPLCHYFKHFNADTTFSAIALAEVRFSSVFLRLETVNVSQAISCVARGPPVHCCG